MAIKLKTKDMAGMAKQYMRMSSKRRSYKRPLAASAKLVAGNNIRRFDKEIDPNGKKWGPLSKKYEAWKKKKFGGKSSKINVLTSRLRTSITSNAQAMDVYKLDDDMVEFGTNVEYAGYVQNVRPILGFSDEDLYEMGKIFDLWLEREFVKESRK